MAIFSEGNYDNHIQRVVDELQRFVSSPDIEMMLSTTLEYAERGHARLKLIKLDRENSRTNNYNESLPGDRVWESPVEFLADVDARPNEQKLTRMGIDDLRSGVVMHVSTAWLRRNEIVPQIGDLVVYEGVEYEILSIIRDPSSYVVNTHIPLFFSIVCDRYRHGE